MSSLSSPRPGLVSAPQKQAAITVREVSKTYRDGRSAIKALDDVSLQVDEGEFVCLLGASGCGKSTLLNLIAGLYHLDRGSIDTGSRRVGLMFQEPALFPWLTVIRNIEMAMRFSAIPRTERADRISRLVRLVHLEGFGDRRPHELSGGMQQRAALARALAQDADVLLMDEPFGALDAMTRDLLHDELEGIWTNSRISVLFVTHNVREAVRLGDRVVVLSSRPGRVAAEIPVDLPRPRDIDSREVGEITAEITGRLRQEVRRHGR
ncbi:MAG TPA: ABC transporter ATP-binding protein [Acidimicrobiia bacterium]|nr:ABC transporter ATP-binding protein [Acidimicrobiia bacterium]